MSAFDLFISTFNTSSKGLQFEHFVKWFLKNDPEWATQVDEVWLWNEYPDRWGPDCGIDLVFRHKNGEIWAVQAKCYDAKYSITKKDVDTFLSESNRQSIDKRLLIASTDHIGRNARQVCQSQEKPVVFFLYSDFDTASIDYPSDISQLKSAKRKEPPKPRSHQVEAIDNVVKGFKSAERGQMIMACGTGKTFTTLWVKEALKAKTTLVLLPSLSLLSQTLREWTSAASEPFEALCVCSDETVGRQSNDELISSVQDVAFPTTSDPKEIKDFLNRDVCKIVFSTYHSSPSIAEAQSGNSVASFDLVVADEAHRCTGEAGKAFTTVLDASLIKANKRLFTTATPRTYSPNIKKKASDMGVDITDMSDESSFGKVFHNLTFGQAIDDDLLTDYRVVVIGVDEPMISKWIKNRELIKTDSGELTDAKTLASQIGLVKAIKDYNLKRMISFHSRVSSAKWFAKDIHNAINFVSDEHRPDGDIYTDFVSGSMSSYDRGLKLSQLKDLSNFNRGLLTNARCLSEGVDVPSLDGVAFIDPRSSQVDIVQAVGRAIRKSNSKTIGTIVLPVFIENTDNVEESLQSSNFKPIWGVLNALKSHDETLSLELDKLRTNLGRQGGKGPVGNLTDKIVFDLPKTVDKSFSDSLRTYAIDKTTDSWEFWYGLLLSYIDKKGSTLVSSRYQTEDRLKLGQWVSGQRKARKKNILTPRRIKKLNDVGFIWDILEYQWDEGFKHIKEYVDENEDALVPRNYKTGDGFKLGIWTGIQRNEKIKGKISLDRIQKLDEIGFIWNALEDVWNEGYKHLKQYVKDNGDALVGYQYKADKFFLGRWVGQQRNEKAKGRISSDRLQKLDEIGFIWDTVEYKWNQNYKYLKQYVQENGNALVSNNYKIDGQNLGTWVSTQRADKAKGKIPSNRIQKLNKLGFIWDVIDYNWNEGITYLKEYISNNGDALVPNKYQAVDGYKLGSWVRVLRHNNGELTKERKQELDELGFVWDVLEYQWNEGVAYLKEYISNNGDALVPNHYETENGYKLGSWVQRKRKDDSLTKERRQELNKLGFVWDVSYETSWVEGFGHLQQYITHNNNVLVPSRYKSDDGFKLGQWVRMQREKKHKLSSKRIEKLDELGFIWDVLEYRWNENYKLLFEYFDKYGDALVPIRYKTDGGFNLGQWVSNIRSKPDGVTFENKKKLNKLDFVWDVFENKWNEGYKYLHQYFADKGNVFIPQKYKTDDGFNLGLWVSHQRQNKVELSSKKINKLDDLGFIWNTYGHLWNEGYQNLKKYVEANGNALVAKNYTTEDNYKLGSWVVRCRQKKTDMTKEQIKKLDILGFVWNVKNRNN